jgi:hypothetical protein
MSHGGPGRFAGNGEQSLKGKIKKYVGIGFNVAAKEYAWEIGGFCHEFSGMGASRAAVLCRRGCRNILIQIQ